MLSFTSILLALSLALVSLAAALQPAQHGQVHQGLRKRRSPCKFHPSVRVSTWSAGAAVTTSSADDQDSSVDILVYSTASFLHAGVDHLKPYDTGPESSHRIHGNPMFTLSTASRQTITSSIVTSPSSYIGAAISASTPTPSASSSPTPMTSTKLSPNSTPRPTLSTASSSSHSQSSAERSSTASSAYSTASNPAPMYNGPVAYQLYKGDGSSAMGWPTQDKWLSFDNLWTVNQPLMNVGCQQWGVPNPSEQERNDLRAAIEQKSRESGVDNRFILAIILQESNGCPRAPTTFYSVANTGLCQSHQGAGTCNSAAGVLSPCPASAIQLMIDDGVQGAGTQGYNLKDKLASAKSEGANEPGWSYYLAAEEYNGGSRPASRMLEDNVATKCYASDIANRLLGWYSLTGTPCVL